MMMTGMVHGQRVTPQNGSNSKRKANDEFYCRFLNTTLAVNDDGVRSAATEKKSFPVTLMRAAQQQLRLYFFETSDQFQLNLLWEAPALGIAKVHIPPPALYRVPSISQGHRGWGERGEVD